MTKIILDTFSYRGSLGATHIYGTLKEYSNGYSPERQLQHPLSFSEARRTNSKYRNTYDDYTYNLYKVKPGEISTQFETESQIIDWAKKLWLYYFPEGTELYFKEKIICTRETTPEYKPNEDLLYIITGGNVSIYSTEEKKEIDSEQNLENPEIEELEIKEEVKIEKKNRKDVTDFPSVEFSVKGYNTHPGDDGIGLAVFQTFVTDVTDDDGKELGSIGGGTGYVVVSIKDGGYFLIPHSEIWYAINNALERNSK